MKNLTKLILILSVALLMISCSEDGKLTVINKSSEEIDVTIDGASIDDDLSYNEESETQTWSIAYGDEKNVPITATGYWLLDYSTEVTISPGDDVLHEINSNCGKIQIINSHPTLSIWYVYLSVSTDDDWGDDQLGSDIIEPNETYAWYASSEYTWDIKIVDGDDNSYEIYGDEVLDGEETLSYTFSSSANIVPNSPIKTKYQNALHKEVIKPNVSVKKIGKVK
ncbi:MAG: hypothetical protein U9R41_02975 [Candidatus Marinimicrobia bacterium]|nr:hypothetical protein [Candidatus Neomarinimicrobiota bacterium]